MNKSTTTAKQTQQLNVQDSEQINNNKKTSRTTNQTNKTLNKSTTKSKQQPNKQDAEHKKPKMLFEVCKTIHVLLKQAQLILMNMKIVYCMV